MAITLHADGRILNSAGINIAAAPMVDMWRLHSDHTIATSANSYITSNWERVDTDGFSKIGAGLSESSGVFSFPQTGIYQISGIFNFRRGSGAERYVYNSIMVTQDNGTYTSAATTYADTAAGLHRSFTHLECVFNVTNISTHKFKIREYSYNGSTVAESETSENANYITVIRLGDS